MLSINFFQEPKKLTKFDGFSYRNIYTIIESQNLFDDLIANPQNEEKIKTLQIWENNSSDISHTHKQKNRVFQYGNAENSIGGVFAPPYNQGRFGDGVYFGVWYGALEQETSILESLYHQSKRVKAAFKQKGSKDTIITERKMFKAKLQTHSCLDLCNLSKKDSTLFAQLTHPTIPKACLEIGQNAFKNNVSMLLTPSARNKTGVCTPVFQEKVIQQETFIYYLRWIFYRNGKVEQEKISQKKIDFKIPREWSE